MSQERGVLQMGRQHGGGVAAERGRLRALGALRGARGGAAGRVAPAQQARRARARARRRRRAAQRQPAPLAARERLAIPTVSYYFKISLLCCIVR